MAAVNTLLLFFTTLAPNTFPPDGQTETYTPPAEWYTVYEIPYAPRVEMIDEFDDLPPCTPVIPPVGEMRCPPNSHYKPCGPVCPRSCIRYHCPLNCCVEGCFCDEGYVMGYNGSCIREEECSRVSDMDLPYQIKGTPDEYPSECGPNEYIGCDPQSERNCSNYRYLMAPRSEPCTLGCVCIPPMIRGPEGYCILPEQCPSTTLTNAIVKDWLICNFMRVSNPDGDCLLSTRQCDNPGECPDDDFEEENYIVNRTQLGDEMKRCFPDHKSPAGPEDCNPAMNEQYYECAPICFPTCTAYYCPFSCCLPGCYCPEGYVRGPRAKCIPKDECPHDTFSLSNNIQDTYDPVPVSCSPEEIISCDSHCQLNCSNYYSEFTPCPDDTCVLGCVCKPPKIRGPDGDCVLPEQCHPRPLNQPDEISKMDMMRNFLHIRESAIQQSSVEGPLFKCRKKHEYLNLCTYTCPDTCDDYKDKSRTCKKICLPIPRCDCEEGYVRGPSGDCITPEECPNDARTPDNCTGVEYYDPCGPVCEANCTTYYGTNVTCENKSCRVGCFCKPGLIRGPDGNCIWPFECFVQSPKILKDHGVTLEHAVCPKDEEWQFCGTACPKNCTNFDKAIPCIQKCVQGCFCKEPRVRGPDGSCILVEECPRIMNASRISVCPENEEWQFCGTACPKNCTNYDKDIPCVAMCSTGCFCKEPRVRGPDGTCILIEECPARLNASPVCPENEYYVECQADCQKNCTNYDQNIACSTVCKSGCVCKPPLVRGPDFTCVNVEECTERRKQQRTSPVCPENEYYVECQADCQKNCTNYDQNIVCSTVCKSGCVCRPPLVRGPDFTCVNVEECTEKRKQQRNWLRSVGQFPAYVCGENERFSFCKSICPDNCNDYQQERFCKHICLPGCACIPGYVLSRDGVCIKQEHCVEDRPEDCSELETYNDCGSYCEVDCFNFNMASRDCYTKECRKGCFCKPGWVRSPDMKCIRPYECPRRSRIPTRHGRREWPF